LRSALDEHEAVSYLTMKLSGVGDHPITDRELSLTVRGLDRYVRLLEDHLDDVDVEDFVESREEISSSGADSRGEAARPAGREGLVDVFADCECAML
jgi:hypothetical protein